jgi:hypothetical protein
MDKQTLYLTKHGLIIGNQNSIHHSQPWFYLHAYKIKPWFTQLVSDDTHNHDIMVMTMVVWPWL